MSLISQQVLKRMIKPSVACLVLLLMVGLYSTVEKYHGQKGFPIIKVKPVEREKIVTGSFSDGNPITPKQEIVEEPEPEVAPGRILHQHDDVDTAGDILSVRLHLSNDIVEAQAEAQAQAGDWVKPARPASTTPRPARVAGPPSPPPPINLDQRDVDVDELFRRFVVVTAFSENHRLEAMGMIGTVQQQMPYTPIIVYDIGIAPANLSIVRGLCNVEVRPFEFHKYPAFVSNIMTYAWKVIIIKESLNEFGVIFWADTSVRFKLSLRTLLPFAKQHHGYLSRIHSYRALTSSPIPHNYFFTQQKMFDYFAVVPSAYARSTYAPHVAANRQLLINSTAVQDRLIRPLYACALNETCISPPGSRRGNHQFDAAALMLVIHKYWPKEFNRRNDHLADFDKAVYMHRLSDDWQTALKCWAN